MFPSTITFASPTSGGGWQKCREAILHTQCEPQSRLLAGGWGDAITSLGCFKQVCRWYVCLIVQVVYQPLIWWDVVVRCGGGMWWWDVVVVCVGGYKQPNNIYNGT